MIFVDDVVAVDWVFSEEIPESQKNLHFFKGVKSQHVLLGLFITGRILPISQEDSKLLKVNVNWVGPTASVDQSPNLAVRLFARDTASWSDKIAHWQK